MTVTIVNGQPTVVLQETGAVGPPGPTGPAADTSAFITSGVPGTKLTQSQTAPPSPHIGDIWLVLP